MKPHELTGHEGRATSCGMQRDAATKGLKTMAAVGMASLALAGCVTVEAPAEPIRIELTINISQEVIYRLAEDAGNTIEENADIF